jgi:non-ribosomal peptide synthetase component F
MSDQARDPLAQAAARGMSVAYHATIDPKRMAIVSPAGGRSFGELNGRINQLARAFRAAGVKPGDGIALLVGNRPEFNNLPGGATHRSPGHPDQLAPRTRGGVVHRG